MDSFHFPKRNALYIFHKARRIGSPRSGRDAALFWDGLVPTRAGAWFGPVQDPRAPPINGAWYILIFLVPCFGFLPSLLDPSPPLVRLSIHRSPASFFSRRCRRSTTSRLGFAESGVAKVSAPPPPTLPRLMRQRITAPAGWRLRHPTQIRVLEPSFRAKPSSSCRFRLLARSVDV